MKPMTTQEHVVKNVRVRLREGDWQTLRVQAAEDNVSLTASVGVELERAAFRHRDRLNKRRAA